MRKILSLALDGVMLLAGAYQADAQINLNSLKNAAKNKASSVVKNATGNSSSQTTNNNTVVPTEKDVVSEVKKVVVDYSPVHNVPCPWPMAIDDRDQNFGPVVKYIESLGDAMLNEVQPLKDSILARAREDTLELARLKPHRLEMTSEETMAYDKMEKELNRLDYFFSMLGNRTTRLGFNGTVNVETGQAQVNYIQASVNQTTVFVKWDNDKEYFYNMSGDKCFLEDDDIDMIDRHIRRYYYVWNFLYGQEDPEFKEASYKASICYDCLKKARDNNNVDNIEFQPYPKGGPLNSLAPKALASAKLSSSYSEAIAVVIDAPSWSVDYDAFGQPIRRKAGGWVIKNTKYGKKAFRAQFSEDHMGGGKYGEIKLYGIGGESHYVK